MPRQLPYTPSPYSYRHHLRSPLPATHRRNHHRTMSRIAFKSLCGRSAIVTGSTSGIGFAIAQRLAREGAKVLISSRREKNVEQATRQLQDEGLDVRGKVCHVYDPNSRRELLEEAQKSGGLDILVQAAGANPTPIEVFNTPESSWDKNFDVNVKSSFLLSKEALGMLRQSKAGRIIYIGTVAALAPEKNLGAYACSKAALAGLTKVAAQHLGPDNITVNCILPGVIKTRFSHVLCANEELTKSRLEKIPLNRFGTPEEVSGIVALLASDDGSYITGENIVVAGGMQSRL